MDPGGRESEVDGGDQGATRGHGVRPQQRPAGGGAHHGVRQPPVLRAHCSRLHDRPADARHPADEVRLRSGLHPSPAEQRQLQAAAALGRSDR